MKQHNFINVKNTEEFYLLDCNVVQSVENIVEENMSIFRVRSHPRNQYIPKDRTTTVRTSNHI
jgi:hypothetical protein